MPKRPEGTPDKIGQRVILRGRGAFGNVQKIENEWVWVNWDDGAKGWPKICHANELKVTTNA